MDASAKTVQGGRVMAKIFIKNIKSDGTVFEYDVPKKTAKAIKDLLDDVIFCEAVDWMSCEYTEQEGE